MADGFGFLARLNILQDAASALIANINPAVMHNIEKYHAIKKSFYLSLFDQTNGDYLEFGVFGGSSFSHAIRCYKNMKDWLHADSKMGFYGFDSFKGFGELNDNDKHPFYKDLTFEADYKKVEKRIKKTAKDLPFKLIPGFFEEVLKQEPESYGIRKGGVIFIDSDTYSSAILALKFCLPIIQVGTIIILDDCFSYKGREDRGAFCAFNEFLNLGKFNARKIFDYGMGGTVYIISKINT